MQMETHLVECKIDQSFDYLITAGGHSRREQQTHQQGTVSVRQANPNPSHIQAATSISHLLLVLWVTTATTQGSTDASPFSASTRDGRGTAAAWRMDRAAPAWRRAPLRASCHCRTRRDQLSSHRRGRPAASGEHAAGTSWWRVLVQHAADGGRVGQ